MAYKIERIDVPPTGIEAKDLDPPSSGYEVACIQETRNGELIIVWEHDGGQNVERKLGKLTEAVGDLQMVVKDE